MEEKSCNVFGFQPLIKVCKVCGIEFEVNDYMPEEDTCDDCKNSVGKTKEDIVKDIEFNDYIFDLAVAQMFSISLPESKDLEEFDPYIFSKNTDCPKCGYPVCKDGTKYLGRYISGTTCTNCKYINKLEMAKTIIKDFIKHAKNDYYKKLNLIKKNNVNNLYLGVCK